MRPPLRGDYRRAGPLPTLAIFCTGVIGLVWGVWELNWFFLALGLFSVLGALHYYMRVLRNVPPMDEAEARAIVYAELAELRSATYTELIETLLGKPVVSERLGASGACYQLETAVYWDNPPGGDLRVSAAIDDGGWRAFAPLTDSFILAPDGRFVVSRRLGQCSGMTPDEPACALRPCRDSCPGRSDR